MHLNSALSAPRVPETRFSSILTTMIFDPWAAAEFVAAAGRQRHSLNSGVHVDVQSNVRDGRRNGDIDRQKTVACLSSETHVFRMLSASSGRSSRARLSSAFRQRFAVGVELPDLGCRSIIPRRSRLRLGPRFLHAPSSRPLQLERKLLPLLNRYAAHSAPT